MYITEGAMRIKPTGFNSQCTCISLHHVQNLTPATKHTVHILKVKLKS